MTDADGPRSLKEMIAQVEEAYEYFLAYAAQGYSGEHASSADGEARRFLQVMDAALARLPGLFQEAFQGQNGASGALKLLSDDAQAARALLALALAQDPISSRLVDNFNASSHVRALLTDIFLLGEIVGA